MPKILPKKKIAPKPKKAVTPKKLKKKAPAHKDAALVGS